MTFLIIIGHHSWRNYNWVIFVSAFTDAFIQFKHIKNTGREPSLRVGLIYILITIQKESENMTPTDQQKNCASNIEKLT